jgi:hypothetical protein
VTQVRLLNDYVTCAGIPNGQAGSLTLQDGNGEDRAVS